jgi:transcriptional regulator with XRE-family HTH domain
VRICHVLCVGEDFVAATVNMGTVIRAARAAARLTQAQLGLACGYSASAISRIEAGKLEPGREALLRIAAELGIPPERLGVAMVAGPECQEDAVRRRSMLAGMVGVGMGAALGSSPASAAPVPAGDPAIGLERALFSPDAVPAVSLPRLGKALSAAHADFTAARYISLAQHLPGLLGAAEATREVSAGRAREQAHAAAARGYVLATELALKQHADVAWVAADRALTAARASGEPVVVGEAARVLAITMRRAGRPEGAVDLLRRTASSLEGREGAAVGATLLMTAAYTAACAGQRTDALDLMGEAEQAVARVPRQTSTELFTVDATPAQAALYWIGVHNALGTPDEAVKHARSVNPAVLPTAERRARLGTDTARMWQQLGDPKRTFAALRLVEQAAPEEVRRPALRAMTAGLLYGPVQLPGLREFAQRTGALAAP